jgi:hypothetical protein
MQRNKQFMFVLGGGGVGGGGTRRSHILLALVITRETREGWPLHSFETEANGDSRSSYKRGPSVVGLFGLVFVSVQEIFYPALAAVIGPVQNIFFLAVNYFN